MSSFKIRTFLPAENGSSATLYAVWKINTYTVTFNVNGSGLSRNPTSRTINYGGSGTSTITAASGYYISAASCTNGYTVSVTTGTSATGSRTATVYNNSKLADSTCTFTGTYLGVCWQYGVGVAFKLADGYCWTKTSRGSTTWNDLGNVGCPSGMSKPTKAIYDNLVSKYSGGGLYNATGGWSGHYWSTTASSNTIDGLSGVYAYYLYVESSRALVDDYRYRWMGSGVLCYGPA